MDNSRWTTFWHVGLAFTMFLVIPILIVKMFAGAGGLGVVFVLFLHPAMLGAVLALISCWRERDTTIGAATAFVAIFLPLYVGDFWRGELLFSYVAGAALAGLLFVGSAAWSTYLILLLKSRISRRPS